MWLQEEPQRSTSMCNSRLEAQGAGPLGGTSAVGDIKGYSADNWRGLEGHPARGVVLWRGTAGPPGCPAPHGCLSVAAILVSSDGEGGPESTGLATKSLYAGATGLPCRSDAQHPATTLSAQRAPHIPTALWHTEGHLPPCFTKSRMWAPWQGGYRVPTGTTLALVSPMNWQ